MAAERLPEIGISEMAGGKILYIPYIEANEGRVCKVTVADHTQNSLLLKENGDPYTEPGSDVPYILSEFVRTSPYNFYQEELKNSYERYELAAASEERNVGRAKLLVWIQDISSIEDRALQQLYGAKKLHMPRRGGKRKSKRRKSRRRKTRR